MLTARLGAAATIASIAWASRLSRTAFTSRCIRLDIFWVQHKYAWSTRAKCGSYRAITRSSPVQPAVPLSRSAATHSFPN